MLLAIVFAALVLRVGFVLTRENRYYFPDTDQYAGIARNLLAEGSLSYDAGHRACRSPGYPVFLAGCFAVFGEDARAVRLVQAAIGALTCLLVYALAREMFGPIVGLFAAAAAAVYPFFIFYTGLVLTETLYTAVLAALLPAILLSKRSRWWLPVAGLAGGAAILIRPPTLLLLPLLLLPSLWRKPLRRRAIDALIILTIAGACVVPWAWRNYRIFGHFVPTTLTTGMSLYEANSPYADGGPGIDSIPWDSLDRAWRARHPGEELDEYARDQHYRGLAVAWMREHPGEFLRLAGVKLLRTWNIAPNDPAHRSGALVAVSAVSYAPAVLLAIVGMVAHRRRFRDWGCLLIPALYFSALHAVFVGSVRYRAPAMPFLIVLAAAGAAALVRGNRIRNEK